MNGNIDMHKYVGRALSYEVVAQCSRSKARAGVLTLPHGKVDTPVFMPVATVAALKGLSYQQLEDLGCDLCLNNTYHLGLRPGQETMDKVGGTHKLQGWNRNILTDSGGFQMVSLLKLATITEEGVNFLSPHDGSPMLLTPEHSIDLQNSIGSDIMMQLDDVVHSLTTGPRVREAMERSIRWLDRCIAAHKKPDTQNLYAIIQGGLDLEMRKECCHEMIKRDLPGYAIGGLSGGEDKASFCKVVNVCTDLLPKNKPRYCMGVGYPEDLVVGVALAVDQYDCVFPSRHARFGHALTKHGSLNMRHASHATDLGPIEEGCGCPVCKPKAEGGMGLTRAMIFHVAGKETTGAHLLTLHNIWYLLELMRRARQSIIEDQFPEFVQQFFLDLYPKREYPQWAVDALKGVNIDLIH